MKAELDAIEAALDTLMHQRTLVSANASNLIDYNHDSVIIDRGYNALVKLRAESTEAAPLAVAAFPEDCCIRLADTALENI